MKRLKLGKTGPELPVLALGCMRMAPLASQEAQELLQVCMETGIHMFDHADIYGGGSSERVFARACAELKLPREQLFLQSKCGIRKGFFDFSKEHILSSVDGILERLDTEYLDALLLHRPDVLMEPEEVAEAFDALKASGKVRHFGVSNMHPGQIELLQDALSMPLVANQLQLSIAHAPMIDFGLNVNLQRDAGLNRDGGLLEYCRRKQICIQPWSTLQKGFFGGVFLGDPDYAALNAVLDRIALEQGLSPAAVALGWLLRIPGSVQPILGSMNPQRVREMAKAPEVELSRKEWYELYLAAGRELP